MTSCSLIHVPVSHYSEKARWALDYKHVAHTRRWPPAGFHPLITWVVTRGRHQTVPVLVIDGEAVGDSTAIIGRLEERFPEPPLYPAGAAERTRALELEDWFDEELGPYIRRMVYHHLTVDREARAELADQMVQYGPKAMTGLSGRVMKAFLDLRFSTASPAKARGAEAKVVAALDRLEAELGGRDYLVGDRFTVADLTAASLFYPLVLPAHLWRPKRLPAAWLEFRDEHGERPAFGWITEMFRRHR